MKALSRVVWSEGMHLAQHHFQLQNAWFEQVSSTTLEALFHAPWGLLDCRFDDEALLNGTAAIIAARGIMPDGLPFSFPADPAPDPLRVTDLFSPTQPSHVLLLAVPAHVTDRANVVLEGAPPPEHARFTAHTTEVADETTGTDARTVQVARKNLRLILDSGVPEGWVTMPIARIRRDGAGRFVYDYDFIPPSLRLTASRSLRDMVARLVDMLESRASAITSERAVSAGSAEYAPREIAGFWLLHALNAAIPPLRHWLRTNSVHPEQLYTHLAQLAGALCTFALTSSARDLPAYDHVQPEACFRSLERHIRQHLDVLLPTNAITLPLERTDDAIYTATVTDTRCVQPKSHWFLAVRSSEPAAEVVARTTRLVKVCSAKFIARLVKEAYPGLTIEHVPSPPAELSPRIGTQYFTLGRNDPCWKSILDSNGVGVYLPSALGEVEVELKIVLESKS